MARRTASGHEMQQSVRAMKVYPVEGSAKLISELKRNLLIIVMSWGHQFNKQNRPASSAGRFISTFY